MPKVAVYNIQHEQVGSCDLEDAVFAVPVKEHLFYDMVRYQLAARRSGTHAAKGRGQVSGGGRKPWKQKGTGRARQGSTRSPQWRGGGVVHGPHPRSHAIYLPKKVRRAALRSALSRRCGESALYVVDRFELPEIKTRHVVNVMSAFEFKDMLLVLAERDENVLRSARNLQAVTVLPVEGLNVYDVLKHRNLVLTSAAVEQITARLAR